MVSELVKIDNLSIAFSGVSVVHVIDLHIEKGETVALVGESGCV